MGVKDENVDEKPETTHETKGKRERPSNIKRTIEIYKNRLHDTEKDENRNRTHWRKASIQYSVNQLFKHGWRWPKTQDVKSPKTFGTRIGTKYDRPTRNLIK